MKKFWNFIQNEDTSETELLFNGPISEDTWWGDEVTPALFRDELAKVSGNLTVWLNSPGGDVFAASQIYSMLKSHKGKVTVKIDGIAASAASVVAMAGDETWISPTGYLMIHNPMTCATGNKADMEKAIALLDEIKEGIINAYEEKTHLSRSKIAKMMDEETWINAKKAKQLAFVDGILFSKKNQLKNLTKMNRKKSLMKSRNRKKHRNQCYIPHQRPMHLCYRKYPQQHQQVYRSISLKKGWHF